MPEMPPDTYYWMAAVTVQVRVDRIDHVMVQVGDPKTRLALVVLSLFNLPPIAIRLPFEGNEPFAEYYTIDLLTDQSKDIEVAFEHFISQPWNPTQVLGDLPLYAATTVAVERILKHSQAQTGDSELHRIVSEELGNSSHVTEEAVSCITGRVAKMAVAQMPMSNKLPSKKFGSPASVGDFAAAPALDLE